MKIYTKQGDDGGTGLIGGIRVSKDDARIEAYGTLDELSAAIGLARCTSAAPLPQELDDLLQQIQEELFTIGAVLADPSVTSQSPPRLHPDATRTLEVAIDQVEANLPPLRNFILPGGSPLSAALHWARVISRRAERRVVTLGRLVDMPTEVVPYLNRLSDLLFVLSRQANQRVGVSDVIWQPNRRSSNPTP